MPSVRRRPLEGSSIAATAQQSSTTTTLKLSSVRLHV